MTKIAGGEVKALDAPVDSFAYLSHQANEARALVETDKIREALVRQRIEEVGLSPDQACLFRALHSASRDSAGITITTLAKYMSCDEGATQLVVKSLEERGFIQNSNGKVLLTDAGRPIYEVVGVPYRGWS
jgi:DNA-binding MarR family transcriptional regulator